MSIAIARGHDVCKAINAAQLLGQRSSRSELPTVDLSASASIHQTLLPSDATDVPEVFDLLEQDGEELCRALQRQYLASCGESFETGPMRVCSCDRDSECGDELAQGKIWTALG